MDSQHRLSRRQFVRGAATGAAVVASAMPALAVAGDLAQEKCPPCPAPANMPEKWDDEADVVVVGAGGGGLAAAVEAAKAGVDVLVIEVMPAPLMSNTAICGGVVMGAETAIQKEKGIKDSIAEFKKYLAAVGAGFEDPEITEVWADNAGKTVDWLSELGVVFPPENLYVSGIEADFADVTPPVARGHTTDAHSGRPISEVLYKTAQENKARFLFETAATQLVADASGRVIGVLAESDGDKLAIKAKRGVVLASAGFSRNQEMIKSFMPKLMTGGSFGSPWQKGDGIVMGQALGAKLTNMWIPQAATIGVPTTPQMTPCMVITIWGNPCVMVAEDGKRHFKEDLYYELLYEKIAEQTNGFVWAIWDQDVTDLGGELVAVPAFSKDLSVEIEEGWVKTADTIADLAKELGVDAAVLEETMKTYNEQAEAGEDKAFGKKVGLKPVQKAPFYAAKTVPATCDTAGGLQINTNTQVMHVHGQPIPGLYATGSTTGGWRGNLYPGSGTAVSVTVTFGRIAGKNAAAEKAWE